MDPRISKLVDIMKTLPGVEEPMDAESNLWHHYKLVRCKCCKKDFPAEEFNIIDTGYVKAYDQACKECRKLAKDTCPIVCVRCKAVMLRLEPYRDEDGFEFIRNRAYHVDACPDCEKELGSAMVVEKKIFIKEKYK